MLYLDLVDSLFQAPGIWHLRECDNAGCGLIWLDPAPIEADLPLLYQKYFFSHRSRGFSPGFLPRLRSILYRAYKLAAYLPSVLFGLHLAQRRMRSLFLDDLTPGKLLDVGCGDGTFLHRMQTRGWSVSGLDFDAQAIESAKNPIRPKASSRRLAKRPFPR